MNGLEERIAKLEQEVAALKERNVRVEAGKAWEVSGFRKASIAVVTYIVAAIALYFIGITNYFLSALIPTIGYILSTLSLPFVKKWWIGNQKK